MINFSRKDLLLYRSDYWPKYYYELNEKFDIKTSVYDYSTNIGFIVLKTLKDGRKFTNLDIFENELVAIINYKQFNDKFNEMLNEKS